MKNLFSILIIVSGLVAMSTSCNNKMNSNISQSKIEQTDQDGTQIDNPEMTPNNMKEDCHGVRKTIRTVKDKEGEIIFIGNNILISIPTENKRYKVCDTHMPEVLKVEGVKVRFSGEILEIFHNERLMGTPTRLTKIDII